MIDLFPDTADRLNTSADIVLCQNFENVIVKLQRDCPALLSRQEQAVISELVLDKNSRTNAIEDGLGSAQRALKRQKLMDSDNVKKHMDTRFLLPTSNVCERLFSKIGYTMSEPGISNLSSLEQGFMERC